MSGISLNCQGSTIKHVGASGSPPDGGMGGRTVDIDQYYNTGVCMLQGTNMQATAKIRYFSVGPGLSATLP